MMTVSQLSKHGGVAPHVVRYYSRIGLLEPIRHPENNYKLFSHRDVSRLRFIRQAQSVGFTLDEIAQILEAGEQGESPCPQVRNLLRQRIRENRERLAELMALQDRMEQALEHWEAMPDKMPEGETICHLIEAVGADGGSLDMGVTDRF